MSLSLQHWIQKNRFMSQHFRLASHDSRETSWQHEGSKSPPSSSDVKLLQPPEHPSAAVVHDIGRPHRSLPQQLTAREKNNKTQLEERRLQKLEKVTTGVVYQA